MRMLTVIVPTFNNVDYLEKMMKSLCQYNASDENDPFFHIVVVNNGAKGSVQDRMKPHPVFTVLDTGENLGWEGGLKAGLEWMKDNSPTKYVLFANDDIHFLPNDPFTLQKMIATMENHPEVAGVGPTSNFSAGFQNFSHLLPGGEVETGMIMGYCFMLRREASEQVGGIILGLPGGDDVDLSLRLRKAGHKLAIRTDTYVHHWGERTGKKLHGDYWNSLDMISKTRNEMIRRHGLKSYLNMIRLSPRPL